MLDQINEIISQVTTQIGGDHGIASDKLSQVKDTAQSSIMDTIKGMASGGDMSQITSLLGGNSGGAGKIVQDMISNLSSGLVSKVGLSESNASGFAGSLVPKVMELLSSKMKSGDFDISSITSMLGGGDKGGLMDKLGKLGGLFGKK